MAITSQIHKDPQADRSFKIGLLGQGIGASRTPGMHMAAAAAAGLPYDYRLIDATDRKLPSSVPKILDLLEAEGFDGLNVTHPYKRTVAAQMDVLSDAARNVAAVNTVLFRGGKRLGHNTDHWGFRESLRRGLPDADKSCVLLLGAGGAGGAVAHALLDEGVARLLIRDTDQTSAEALAKSLQGRSGTVVEVAPDVSAAAHDAIGIVNATPVGMAKHPGLPLPAEDLRPDQWVADIVYFPLETALLSAARARGCAVLPGSGMALYQAVRAFELFTGQPPDIERMQVAFEAAG